MARTPGAKNKPKFVVVKLSDLSRRFQPDMDIPVSLEFAKAMLCQYGALSQLIETNITHVPQTLLSKMKFIRNKERYYVKAFCRGRWTVNDRKCFNLPIYSEMTRYQEDRPMIFNDIDKAFECADRLNHHDIQETQNIPV